MLKWEKALTAEALRRTGQNLPKDHEIKRFAAEILDWYEVHGRTFIWRRSRISTYEVLVTEALLQRTKAETVDAFLPRFLQKYPSWTALAAAHESELSEFLQPVGLYRRRAKMFHNLAEAVNSRGGRVPFDKERLAQLPGVGQYVFNAVRLYKKGEPLPLLDASMARLVERYFGARKLADIRYDPYLQQLSRKIVEIRNSKATNWAMLDFAALVCKSRSPICKSCIFRNSCVYRKRLADD